MAPTQIYQNEHIFKIKEKELQTEAEKFAFINSSINNQIALLQKIPTLPNSADQFRARLLIRE